MATGFSDYLDLVRDKEHSKEEAETVLFLYDYGISMAGKKEIANLAKLKNEIHP